VNFFHPAQHENALGPEYIFKWERAYPQKGDTVILRQHFEVIKRDNGKILGETTLYQRGGSALLSLLFLSSDYTYPSINDSCGGTLLNQIFINSTK
jgi:hypothetical protein